MSKRLLASVRASNRGRSLRPRTSQPRLSRPPFPSTNAEPVNPDVEDTQQQLRPMIDDMEVDALQAESAPEATLDNATSIPLASEAMAHSHASVDTVLPADSPTDPIGVSGVPSPDLDFGPSNAVAATRVAPAAAAEPARTAKRAPAAEAARVAETAPTADAASPAHAAEPGPADGSAVDATVAAGEAGAAPDTTYDVLDPSSTTAEFFQRESAAAGFFRPGEDSVPPLIDAVGDPEEPLATLELSPEVIARRARLRRIVAAVVGLAGVITIGVVGKVVFASRSHASPTTTAIATAPSPAPLDAKLAPGKEVKAPTRAEPSPTPAPVEAAKNDAAAAEAKPVVNEPTKDSAVKADAEPAKVDAAQAETAAAANPADAAKLSREALSLLNRGKLNEAVETARAAISADPSDAMPYLYMGSALQDSGKWKEGIAAYSDCVRHATRGPVSECRALGGRK